MRSLFKFLLLFSALSSWAICTRAQQPIKALQVYYFMSETCPVCMAMTREIRFLADTFEKKNVTFQLIFPNYQASTPATIKSFTQKYGLELPWSIDEGQIMTRSYHVTITPQVIVIDQESQRIIYSGMITDEYVALGKRKRTKVNHILYSVINDFLTGEADDFVHNQPVGCFIIRSGT